MLLKYILTPVICSLIVTSNLSAIDVRNIFYDDSRLKSDISQIKSRLDVIENKQKTEVDTLKSEVDGLKQEVQTLKDSFEIANEYQDLLLKYSDALQNAVQAGDANATMLLLDKEADPTPALFQAIRSKQYEAAKILINNGADVNSTTPNGVYLIAVASMVSSGEIVALLIENGAQVDRINNSNGFQYQTPLHWAAQKGNFGTVKALVNGGAKVDGNEGCFSTPLEAASNNLKCSDNPENLELIKFLVNNGATRLKKVYNEGNRQNICPVINDYLKSVNR